MQAMRGENRESVCVGGGHTHIRPVPELVRVHELLQGFERFFHCFDGDLKRLRPAAQWTRKHSSHDTDEVGATETLKFNGGTERSGQRA